MHESPFSFGIGHLHKRRGRQNSGTKASQLNSVIPANWEEIQFELVAPRACLMIKPALSEPSCEKPDKSTF